MAFTEFYCNFSTGSNMSGGSDENASPSYSATNGGWNSSTGVFTPASGDPSASVTVGQFASVFVDGATTPVFVGRVTAVTSTTLTVSTSAKSGTAPSTNASGRSVNVGGVWKGPDGTQGFPFGLVNNALADAAGNYPRVNFKNNAQYDITAAVTHSNSDGEGLTFQGYSASTGDGGRFTLDGGTSGASYVLLTLGQTCTLQDAILQNNGATGSSNGLVVGGSGSGSLLCRVSVNSVRGSGIHQSVSAGSLVECEAYDCNQSNASSQAGFNVSGAASLLRCVSHNNAGSNSVGFRFGSSHMGVVSECVAAANGSDGFHCSTTRSVLLARCVAHGNAGDGLDGSNGTFNITHVENCVFANNTGAGVRGIFPLRGLIRLESNAFYNNTGGETVNLNASAVAGSVTLTGDPFTDAANGDFSLNDTAGAGAACRGAGRGAFLTTGYSSTTVGHTDIGAAQHQDSGGEGSTVIVVEDD